jgi:hypothetical protein
LWLGHREADQTDLVASSRPVGELAAAGIDGHRISGVATTSG